MALLTACVAPGNRPMPLAASGPVAVSLDGAGYIVDLQPGTKGAQMTVTADAGAMANDQGLTAKRVAEAFCDGRGSRLDRWALGRFSAGAWAFNGGCSA
jgi:hypothetical protein